MEKSKKSQITPQLIGSSGDSLREAFGKSLVKLADKYPDLVVLDADIAGGTGTHHFRSAYPRRFFQFGIAEQNMMAAAGGMASIGLIPFVTTFAVFSLRALEQVRLSIAYANRNVKIVSSHPGLDVGPDGASAQALEDLAVFRAIPNMVVISPVDPLETAQATEAIINYNGPVYMRTGRSPAKRVLKEDYLFELGKGKIIREGEDISIIACGVEVARALGAAKLLEQKDISARIVNLSTIKPIDKELIIDCARQTKGIITAEDHNIMGGLGSAVAEVVVQNELTPMRFIGVKDCFGESGEPEELAEKYNLTASYIADAALELLSS